VKYPLQSNCNGTSLLLVHADLQTGLAPDLFVSITPASSLKGSIKCLNGGI